MSATFISLLAKISSVAGSSSDQGWRFEKLTLQFLKNDPGFRDQSSEVWLWNDFTERGKETDTGIDIVAKNRNTDGYTTIQCKFYDEESAIDQNNIASYVVNGKSAIEWMYGSLSSYDAQGQRHCERSERLVQGAKQ